LNGPLGKGPFLFGKTGAAGVSRTHRSPTEGGLEASTNNKPMIATFELDLNEIAICSSDYPWPRPDCCERCAHPLLWGHGFVLMLFAGFAHALRIRRYRCPACGGIIRHRPSGYFCRHQSPAEQIRDALQCRIRDGRWPKGCVTGRARHWMAALKRNVRAILPLSEQRDLLAAFDRLAQMGRVPVARAI